ncbi:aspartyl/glutamyl-tRNA amidotransferase subunit C [Patescibacteria group bacterium]|nr:aspartyl/glutamyl-tRNA amidotransferase subunit C [Patescibacteria group bacterium]
MKFTKDEVQKIAKLSRLMLSEDEEKAMGKDLSEILDYFDILKK